MNAIRMASDPAHTSLDSEHFLSFLFGKQSTHGLANGLLDEEIWRRYRRKVLRELRRYIDANIVSTDALHQQRIDFTLTKIEEAESIGEPLIREQALVAGLVELCLVLLGAMPNHWDRRVVNKAHHRRLDRQQTLTYAQSPEQRAHLIFDSCQMGLLPAWIGTPNRRSGTGTGPRCVRRTLRGLSDGSGQRIPRASPPS